MDQRLHELLKKGFQTWPTLGSGRLDGVSTTIETCSWTGLATRFSKLTTSSQSPRANTRSMTATAGTPSSVAACAMA